MDRIPNYLNFQIPYIYRDQNLNHSMNNTSPKARHSKCY